MRESLRDLQSYESTINICGDSVPYTVFVRRVKYPRIEVSTGQICVIVPPNMRNPHNFLHRNVLWLEKKYKIIKSAVDDLEQDTMLIFGRKWKVKESETFSIDENKRTIFIKKGSTYYQRKLIQWIREHVREKAARLIAKFSKEYDVAPNKIYVRNQKTKWGSCSGKNNISLNIRTIILPDRLFEYIVFHEFVHLIHRNHNKLFWNAVRKKFPDIHEIKEDLVEYWFRSIRNIGQWI